MNECRFQPLISAYYDEELDVNQAADIAGHLQGCPICAAELSLSRQMSAGIAKAVGQSLESKLAARIHAAIDRETEVKPARDSFMLLRTSKLLMAMAASVLIVSGVWLLELRSNSSMSPVDASSQSMAKLVSADWEHYAMNPNSVPQIRGIEESVFSPRYARTVKMMRDGLKRGVASAQQGSP